MQQRHGQFQEVSPSVGQLDVAGLSAALAEDPDAAAELIVDMARAIDPELRAKVRAVAGQLLLPPTRMAGGTRSSGSSRLITTSVPGLDLDADATFERLDEHPRPRGEDLRWRSWVRSGQAFVLLVDASGSVVGRPLANAVVTAAALTSRLRDGDELAVVAFWKVAVVLRDIRSQEPPLKVLDSLFDLRGGDTTNLGAGLAEASRQAGLARSPRRDVVVLSDGMSNTGSDPCAAAEEAFASGARVHVLALADEDESRHSCARIAEAGGGRSVLLRSPADAPRALLAVLDHVTA